MTISNPPEQPEGANGKPVRQWQGGTCPRCGQGDLFTTRWTLQIRTACERCGQDFKFADAGDGPAIFAIFILGFLVLGGALIAEFKFGAPIWLHVALWGILTPLIALLLLRWLKSQLIKQQLRHGAGEARNDQFEL